MSHKGFSHAALTSLDLGNTRRFYEDVLGFEAVACDQIPIEEGGTIDRVFFDIGRDLLIAFMAPRQVADLSRSWEFTISRSALELDPTPTRDAR